MRTRIAGIAMIAMFSLIATACSSGEDDLGDASANADSTLAAEVSSTTLRFATTTVGPSTTATTATTTTTATTAVTTTVPSAAVDAKYSVVVTTGLTGEDTQEITAWDRMRMAPGPSCTPCQDGEADPLISVRRPLLLHPRVSWSLPLTTGGKHGNRAVGRT